LISLCAFFVLSGCGEYVVVSKDRSEQLIEGQRLRYYAEDAQAESLLKQAYASSDQLVKAEAAFQLAELAEKHERHDEALGYLKQAFKAGYPGSEVRLAKAYLTASPGLRNYDAAEKILQEHENESPDAALTLAKLYIAKEQYGKAVPPLQLAEKMYLHSENQASDALQIARVYRDIYYAQTPITLPAAKAKMPAATKPVPQALSKARLWYKTAQDKGNRQEAPVELAKLLLYDAPVNSPRFNEAVALLQAAAAQNNPEAMEKLGQTYYDAEDNEKALYWLTRSEQAGDPQGSSAYSLAKVYKSTKDQPGNLELMQSWYEKAIAKGNLEAKQSWQAYQVQEREKEIIRQAKLKEKLLREAQKAEMRQLVNVSPETEAAFATLTERADKNGAYQQFRQLADSGTSLHAMLMVDSWDEQNKTPAYHSVYQKLDKRKLVNAIAQNEAYLGDANKAQIARQWQLASQYGSGDAAYYLAKHYENTYPNVASEWMAKAIALGSGKAMLLKARETAVNSTGEQTDQQVFNWYQKAAEAGEAEGQYQVGLMYSEGKGVAKNLQKANFWLNKAKKGGYHLASDAMNSAE
jgi:TPR repeat protein